MSECIHHCLLFVLWSTEGYRPPANTVSNMALGPTGLESWPHHCESSASDQGTCLVRVSVSSSVKGGDRARLPHKLVELQSARGHAWHTLDSLRGSQELDYHVTLSAHLFSQTCPHACPGAHLLSSHTPLLSPPHSGLAIATPSNFLQWEGQSRRPASCQTRS